MSLKHLRQFDEVPQSDIEGVQTVYTGEAIKGSRGYYIQDGCIVTRTLSDAVKVFGSGFELRAIYLPAGIPLFWRNSSGGVYAEVNGLQDGTLAV